MAGVLLLLAGILSRMWLLGGDELAAAEAARQRGDAVAQARHLRRAMAHYFPGSPHVSRACTSLASLAASQERAGKRHEAQHTWRELRSAILVLRGVGQPYAHQLALANTRLADLGKGATTLARLQNPRDPNPGWAALAITGFILWVGAAVLMILQGLKPDLKLVPKRFWPLLALVATGWALFAAGLGLA
jgi:hypothetical protein